MVKHSSAAASAGRPNKRKAAAKSPMPSQSQGMDSDSDSEPDFDPALLLAQIHAKKSQKTKKDGKKMQKWSSDAVRKISAAADAAIAGDNDDASADGSERDLAKLERVARSITEGKDKQAQRSNQVRTHSSPTRADVPPARSRCRSLSRCCCLPLCRRRRSLPRSRRTSRRASAAAARS